MSTATAARPSSTCTCTCWQGTRCGEGSPRSLPPRSPAPRAAVPAPAHAPAWIAVVMVVVVVDALGPQVHHVGSHARIAVLVLADLARLVAVDLSGDGEFAALLEHLGLVEAV